MKRQSQPRIKGIKRIGSFVALHPIAREVIDDIAHKEGKSVSYVTAEFMSGCYTGVNVVTGELVKRPRARKRGRNGRR